MITFSNPRLHAEIPNWPLGGNKRGLCVFNVEFNPKRGYRASRTTTGKPKYTTYSGKMAIVDGSDGRTYMIHRTMYGSIMIVRSDFYTATDINRGSVDKSDVMYTDLDNLIDEANHAQTVLNTV